MLGSLWERGKLKLAVDSATSTADEPTPSEPAARQPIATCRCRAVNPPGFLGGCAASAHATPSSQPLAVYVLDELVQALGAGDSRAGVDAVCARLAHRSPIVKQKVGGRECLLMTDRQTGVGSPGWSRGVEAAGQLARQLSRSLSRLFLALSAAGLRRLPSNSFTTCQQSTLSVFTALTKCSRNLPAPPSHRRSSWWPTSAARAAPTCGASWRGTAAPCATCCTSAASPTHLKETPCGSGCRQVFRQL